MLIYPSIRTKHPFIFDTVRVVQNDHVLTRIAITPLGKDKAFFYSLPQSKIAALSSSEKLLLTRLASLSGSGKNIVPYSDLQANKELGFSSALARKLFQSLNKKGFIKLSRGRSKFGVVRQVTVTLSKIKDLKTSSR